MDSQRRAEIEAMGVDLHEREWVSWAERVIDELLAEIDRLNSERTSMIEHHAFRWLDRAQHDPTQPEDDEQHEPVQQAVPPPGME
jgi:hypothetical protein